MSPAAILTQQWNVWERTVEVYIRYLEDKGIFTKGIFGKLKTTLRDSGFSVCAKTGNGLNDGIKMLDILMTESSKIDASKWISSGNCRVKLLTLHPELANNLAWKALFPKLLQVTQKGTGAGEIVLKMILKDVRKEKDQDVNASGIHIEIKTKNASIKAHGKERQSFRMTNEATKECGWLVKPRYSKLGIWEEKDLSLISKYISKVYDDWSIDVVNDVAKKVLSMAPDEAEQYFGGLILDRYRACDGFEMYVHMDERNGEAVVVSDFTDKDFILDNLKFTVTRRGNSTQALADGYAGASVRQLKKRKGNR
tara:strand:- start:49 stop:978 length:930 start_codon:yes stop_codon:yes gene_type:complete